MKAKYEVNILGTLPGFDLNEAHVAGDSRYGGSAGIDGLPTGTSLDPSNWQARFEG